MNKSSGNDEGVLWEVFIQEQGNSPHKHAGSIRANDPEMAIQNARDVFARRGKITNMWVVRTQDIHATKPDDIGSFFEPSGDKAYRHPQFYKHTLDDELWKKP